MPVLRHRAAGWCLRRDQPRGAGVLHRRRDVDTAARLVEKFDLLDRAARPDHHLSGGVLGGLRGPARDRGRPTLAVPAAFTLGDEQRCQSRLSGVPMWLIAGHTLDQRPGPMTWPSRRRPRALAQPVPSRRGADARRRRRGRRRPAEENIVALVDPLMQRVGARPSAATLMAATRARRMRPASERESARTTPSGDDTVRTVAGGNSARRNGAWPRAWPDPHEARRAAGRGLLEDSSLATLRVCAAQARSAMHRETSWRCARNSSVPSGCGIC